MRRRTECPRRLLAALVGSLLIVGPVRAVAQTQFQWPDTAVDVAKYPTVEYCLAAVERAKADVKRAEAQSGIWRDTLPRDPQRALSPAPAIVTETAARCAAQFTDSTTELDDFTMLFELYLHAGRDADAAALLERRLAALPDTATRAQRTAIVDGAVKLYLAGQPARVAAAETLLLERAKARGDRIQSLAIYEELMEAAQRVGDTAMARRAAERIVATADSLTKAERESDEFEELNHGGGGEGLVFEALNVIEGEDVFLDSLRRSTAAYAAAKRANWLRATRGRYEALDFPIGAQASTLTADFWFPGEAAKAPRPTPGRISLLVFLPIYDICMRYGTTEATTSFGGFCVYGFARLHRLTQRFPELEVTVVAQTQGHFYYKEPPSPAEEAAWIHRWMEAYDVPGAIAVSTTPFWRLPAPDDRRINQFDRVPNVKNYSFHGVWDPMQGMMIVLVDQDGRIIINHGGDSRYTQYIEALLERQRGGV